MEKNIFIVTFFEPITKRCATSTFSSLNNSHPILPYIHIRSQLYYAHMNISSSCSMAFLYDETVMTLIYLLSRSHLHTEHIFYPMLSNPKGSNRQRNKKNIDTHLIYKKPSRQNEGTVRFFFSFMLASQTIHSWFYLYCAFIARRTACIWSDKMNGENTKKKK